MFKYKELYVHLTQLFIQVNLSIFLVFL